MKLLKKEKVLEDIVILIHRENLKCGDRIPTEQELCETFAVSRVTLRGAIDILVTDGILQRNGRNGTCILSIPALGKVKNTTASQKQILFVYFSSHKNTPIEESVTSSEIFRGIERFIEDNNDILMIQTGDNFLKMSPSLLKNVDGIVLGGSVSRKQIINIQQKSTPLVVVGLPIMGMSFDSVFVDSQEAGYLASQKLFQSKPIKNQLFLGMIYDDEIMLQSGYEASRQGAKSHAINHGCNKVLDYNVSINDLLNPKALESASKKLLSYIKKYKIDGIVGCSHSLHAIFSALIQSQPSLVKEISICTINAENENLTVDHIDSIYIDLQKPGYFAAKRLYEKIEDPTSQPIRNLIPI